MSIGCYSFFIGLQMNEKKNGRSHIKQSPSKKKGRIADYCYTEDIFFSP